MTNSHTYTPTKCSTIPYKYSKKHKFSQKVCFIGIEQQQQQNMHSKQQSVPDYPNKMYT